VKDPLEEASADVTRKSATLILVAFLVGLMGLAIFRPGTRDVLAIIFGLVLMVMLHEAGHFIVAKRAGMKCTEFFVGFGPKLWSFRRGETEYGIKAVLLGGYVRILGMTNLEEIDPEDEPRTFRRGSYKNRLKVVLAGVTVNILLAFVFFTVAIAGRGEVVDHTTTKIGTVSAKTAAAAAGLKAGDRIVAANGTRLSTWDQLVEFIHSHGDKIVELSVMRNGNLVKLTATPEDRNGEGFLGVSGGYAAYRGVSALGAVPESVDRMGLIVTGTVDAIGNLFTPSGVQHYSQNFSSGAPAKGAPIEDRPRSIIGFIDVGSQITNGDPWILLELLAGISLTLALFNLLPLLPFDGGHARIVLYEWAMSKYKHREVRVDFRRLAPEPAIVLAFFLILFVSTAYLDIRDLVGS
jgi:membrane-associated protease RseP (regulator of RpoE activity)